VFTLVLVLVLVLVLAGCGSSVDVSGYEDQAITIVGLTDEEFTVTPAELAKLELASGKATGATAKAGTVKAKGPTLKTFIEHYGRSPEDLKIARFIAKDEYRVTLHENGIQNWNVILSISSLSESEQPLRLLIPEAESGQWIYGVVRIEFE